MSRTATGTWKRVVRQVREIGSRDALPCTLCGGARGPIDYRTQAEANRDAEANGQWWLIGQHRPLALSVDHVIPAAAGGTDTLDNAAPSHAVCNASAGAKGTARNRTPPRQRPQAGVWRPLDRSSPDLPGHDVPGRQTATHVFIAPPPGPGPPGARSSVTPTA